ncbi:MAG: glycoside hydrolase family 1 protein [Candidatus Heimdallarchaeota archaeon]|nr:glycoside hydrolase family 1 protein [Candidatus Heimdallarchaeota archaeon]MCK4955151.1 glycoside hydrolase family 1 protein [Candidatus Heimdallarchaeota archaeon]
MSREIVFPEDFLWGSAVSSYQTEGMNSNCDWWEFEQVPGNIKSGERCGLACNHYNLYDSDYELLSSLGQNAHRTSIEWSRIMPTENEIDNDEIEHYHKVFESLKNHNLEGFVTVHHFTVPLWFEKKGGFLKAKNLKYFAKYCEILAKNYPEVQFWNTINEPNVLASMSFLSAEAPPKKNSIFAFFRATRNILKAHAIAYQKLKKFNPKCSIGIVKNFPYFIQKYENRFMKKWVATFADNVFNQVTINMLKTGNVPLIPLARKKWLRDTSDFIGVNFYNMARFIFKLGFPVDMLLSLPDDERLTQMGWSAYHKGLYEALMRTHNSLRKPIYITESGIGTLDDNWRKEYILEQLIEVKRAIQSGADIRGYFYWSSLDNWEWAEGFEPRFGLIGIDYSTQKRKIKDSAKMYGTIAKQNKIPKELLEKYLLSS